jgi:ribonuclease-3
MDPIETVEERLGKAFRDRALLRQALTHPSAALEGGGGAEDSYERMEFLGDSLVNLCLAEILFETFPQEREGTLTKLRAYWVSRRSLAQVSRELGLDEAVLLGEGMRLREGGRSNERILAAVFEAVVAALYLDSGWRATRSAVRRLFLKSVRRLGLEPLGEDSKTLLQERRQAAGKSLPRYESRRYGDLFRCTVYLDDSPAGSGEGRSRKVAEQAAAREVLRNPR